MEPRREYGICSSLLLEVHAETVAPGCDARQGDRPRVDSPGDCDSLGQSDPSNRRLSRSRPRRRQAMNAAFRFRGCAGAGACRCRATQPSASILQAAVRTAEAEESAGAVRLAASAPAGCWFARTWAPGPRPGHRPSVRGVRSRRRRMDLASRRAVAELAGCGEGQAMHSSASMMPVAHQRPLAARSATRVAIASYWSSWRKCFARTGCSGAPVSVRMRSPSVCKGRIGSSEPQMICLGVSSSVTARR